jgi:hypothetical protein
MPSKVCAECKRLHSEIYSQKNLISRSRISRRAEPFTPPTLELGPKFGIAHLELAQHLIDEQAPVAGSTTLNPDTVLVMPLARNVLMQWDVGDAGEKQLTLFYFSKEITFDEPSHFAFGENLASNARFRAGDAAGWGAIGWEVASTLLNMLIDEDILRPASESEQDEAKHDNQTKPSPVPPAPMAAARSWMDAESLMKELTGTALDINYLELVVPVFRAAHLFVDRDGRQVGEANVFPMPARIEMPTDWRGCAYPGNRYQPDKPMNVTALRAMRQHWRQMMGLLLHIRERFLTRFPDSRSGWTVGEVERLCTTVLALPTYMMLRCDKPVANGDLHPALSNLFRVTDGLRMVMHQMMFIPVHEAMVMPKAPINTATILAYAERNYSFHSPHAVCAGPRFMIEDFVAVLLDGIEPRGGLDPAIEPELLAVIDLIDPAMDYAIVGLRAHFTTFALWPDMARAYERLYRLLDGAEGAGGDIARRFEDHFASLSTRSYLAKEEWRQHREAVYDEMVGRCADTTAGQSRNQTLSALLQPGTAAASLQLPPTDLAAAVLARLGDAELSRQFSNIVMEFLLRGQKIVALIERIQAETGALLHRAKPAHRLTLAHLNLHNVLVGEDLRTVPFLLNEIASLFAVDIHVDAETIEITDRPSANPSSHSSSLVTGD